MLEYLCILNVLLLIFWFQTQIKQIISPAHSMSYGTWLECTVLWAIFSMVVWDPKEGQVCHLDESALRHLRLEGSPYQRWAHRRGWVASPALCWQLTIDNWANWKDLRSLICRSVWSLMFDSTLCGRQLCWQSFFGVCWVDSAKQWQEHINIGVVKVWQNVSVNLNDDFSLASPCILRQFFGFVHLSTKTFHLTTFHFRVGRWISRKGRRICGPAMPSRTSWGPVGFLCVGTGCFQTQVTEG